MKTLLASLFRFLSSLKLAVIVILALGTISAWGTIVEAKFDAQTAQKLVYQSVWMYLAMGLLIVNLVFVMVDRLPWKRHHSGFILAHIGIIILIFGSYLTQKMGLDGTMVLNIGESTQWVTIPGSTDLNVYLSRDGDKIDENKSIPVDFLKYPPSEKNPYIIDAFGEPIHVVDFMPYAMSKSEIIETQSDRNGPAVRFQLKSDRVNVVEWMIQETSKEVYFDLGPAKIILTRGEAPTPAGNALVIAPHVESQKFHYLIFTASKGGLTKKGVGKIGDVISTGWMGIELRVLSLYQHASRKYSYERLESPNPRSTSAIKVRFKDTDHWVGIASPIKMFTNEHAYFLSYDNKQVRLPFSLGLKKFEVGRYPGTLMAASYQSLVDVPDLGEHLISMNEPLKHKGLTFYQASFREDENGQPVASILSVNDDPGRWFKYAGASLILLGSVVLFYFKKKMRATA